MQPIPMNEFLQQALKECYFDVELDVIEWNALFNNWRAGAKDPSSRGAHATNVTFAAMDPFFAMVRFTSSKTLPPVSNNWGYFTSPELDQLIAAARTSFDGTARDAALAKLHAKHRRRGAVPVGRSRRRSACDEPEGQGRRAAQELVHRHRDDEHGMSGAAGCPATAAGSGLD